MGDMNIQHNPIFDVEKVSSFYTNKDQVPVKYVCTSSPNENATYAADIFYRETPHPEFGNRYFGLYVHHSPKDTQIMITNADIIEELEFEMIEVDGAFHYSQHRHDYRDIGKGIAIDGGRAYFRSSFSDKKQYLSCTRHTMKVRDGSFVRTDK
jgi:hypothetical protein